ncbi:MAG: 1-acyl-sn-glycerol-3-phosphate acyltransferase [Alphaproteobacteria bacterium]|nr:1-acyl-sn-glycerol-3-phosphate acyltransferase [Alphaproteobacteria bacterium]
MQKTLRGSAGRTPPTTGRHNSFVPYRPLTTPLYAPHNRWRTLTALTVLGVRFLVFFARNLDVFLDARRRHGNRSGRTMAGGLLRSLGVTYAVEGEPHTPPDCGTILVGNHLSYLDIGMLFHAMQPVFLARAALWEWPVVRTLMRHHDSLPMSRDASELSRRISAIVALMQGTRRLIIFAEATTSNGRNLRTFNRGLFMAGRRCVQQGVPFAVQPFSVRFDGVAGLPRCRRMDAVFCWHDAMTALDHIQVLVQFPSKVRATLVFHPPLHDQKLLANAKQLNAVVEPIISTGVRHAPLQRHS